MVSPTKSGISDRSNSLVGVSPSIANDSVIRIGAPVAIWGALLILRNGFVEIKNEGGDGGVGGEFDGVESGVGFVFASASKIGLG